MRSFTEFRYREAAFLLACSDPRAVRTRVISLRRELGAYIESFPDFLTSLEPLSRLPGSPPEIALRMHRASSKAGVGPMAAVAGTVAQMAAEEALRSGSREAIINNGGDIFLSIIDEAVVGLFGSPLAERLAFRILREDSPLAICSSSSTLGHSRSFGRAELATVVAADASLADAAATSACNLSLDRESAEAAAAEISSIPGIRGVLIVIDGELVLAGKLPQLIPGKCSNLRERVVRHPLSER